MKRGDGSMVFIVTDRLNERSGVDVQGHGGVNNHFHFGLDLLWGDSEKWKIWG